VPLIFVSKLRGFAGVTMLDHVEILLHRVIEAASPPFSQDEKSEVQRFIDVNEYGIALETVVAIYVEEQKVANPEAVALIEEAANAMTMNWEPLITGLKRTPS
jgi:hypothetical protein